LDGRSQALGVILLLVSAAFTELASNIVYVVIVEQAYQLGNGASAIGIVLIVQAAAQVIFGSWAGGLADRWGFRKAAGIAALVTSLLLPALAIAQDILVVYVLAFFFMLARLLLIPARFGLVSQVSDRANLIQTNTAVLIVAGAGSFVGPAIAAVLLLATNDFGLALLLAGAGWILSVPPLVMIQVKPELPVADRRLSFFDEMQTGWRLIRRRITISQVLVCLILAALFLGAITPLFTPLSRQLGLGTGGTGVLFSALGFGYLIGPVVATALFKRIRLSSTLLIAGFLAPIGLVLVGTPEHLAGVLIAIALVSAAGAGVNVIVTTITQRLTPPNHRGSVLGTEQTVIGLAWIVSLGLITVLTAAWDAESNVRLLFLIVGGIGFISILSCWLWNKRPTLEVCVLCEPRFAISPVACGMLQGVPFGLAHAACSLICGEGCQRCT
jgi:MFS family permease